MILQEKITEIKEWLNENKRDVIIGLLIILTATLSFGLGYLANREFTRSPIIIEKCSTN